MQTSPQELVERIDKLRLTISENRHSPEIISECLEGLAFAFSDLGDLMVDATVESDRLEDLYKYEIQVQFMAHKKTLTVAESEIQARLDCDGRRQEWREAEKNAKTLKVKRESVEKILDATRSRLSLIKGDIQRA